jgi:D-hexose-6-phosphate mutarotase
MSQASRFEVGAPIRGGVPVCFPWFGPNAAAPGAPPHGVVRVKAWTLDRAEVEQDGTAVVSLSMTSDAGTRAAAPVDFALTYTVRLGEALSMTLTVANPADTPLTFEEAATYLPISDIRQVGVEVWPAPRSSTGGWREAQGAGRAVIVIGAKRMGFI